LLRNIAILPTPTHSPCISIISRIFHPKKGKILDKKRLDEGGFGLTYLAIDTHLDKSVAIKEYMPSDFAVRQDDTTVVPKHQGTQEDYQWGLEAFIKVAKILVRFELPLINQQKYALEYPYKTITPQRPDYRFVCDDALKCQHVSSN
jgi:hypothetical protein